MRQSGIVAAAALYALDHHVTRLADDHANAALFVRLLASEPQPHFIFETPNPITNLILFKLQGVRVNAVTFVELALQRAVRLRALPDGRLRVTTHLDVTRDQIVAAAAILNDLARELAADAS